MRDPRVANQSTQTHHFPPIVQALAWQARAWEHPVLLNSDSQAFEVDHALGNPATAENRVQGMT